MLFHGISGHRLPIIFNVLFPIPLEDMQNVPSSPSWSLLFLFMHCLKLDVDRLNRRYFIQNAAVLIEVMRGIVVDFSFKKSCYKLGMFCDSVLEDRLRLQPSKRYILRSQCESGFIIERAVFSRYGRVVFVCN